MKNCILFSFIFPLLMICCAPETIKDEQLEVNCETLAAEDIDHESAMLNGKVSILYAQSKKGNCYFYYSTNSNDVKDPQKATKINAGELSTKGGDFSSAVTNLLASTKYFFVASYIIDGQEFYGDIKSFSTTEKPLEVNCETLSATEIDHESAVLNGKVAILNTQSQKGECFFYYSTNSGDLKKPKEATRVSAGELSTVGGEFSSTISNLLASTTYYYVAAYIVDDQEFYGSIRSFSTNEKPNELIATGEPITIKEIEAVLSGYANLPLELGNASFGIIYSQEEEPTIDNGQIIVSKTLDSNNMFSITIKNLVPNTTYYYKAFVQNGVVYEYGKTKSFTTLDFSVSVINNGANSVAQTTATLMGKLTVNSVSSLTQSAWFIISRSNNVETIINTGSKISATLDSNGNFSAVKKNLYEDRDYFFLACAKVCDRVFYSDVSSFRTKDYTYTEPNAIDMGLIMTREDGSQYRLLWADRNLGASFYYAWGELYESENYSLNNYKWYDSGWTKYNSSDNKKVLDLEDDVAHVKLGGSWRMPTIEEWLALEDICDISGNPAPYSEFDYYWKLTSKITGKSIQLGYSYYASGTMKYYDQRLRYWSSSIGSGNSTATIYTNASQDGSHFSYYPRYLGLHVRPVLSADVILVESVSLDKAEYNFNTIGNTLTLKATVFPDDATIKSLEWTSDNTNVATVDANGKVKAIGNGMATIIVKSINQGKTASCVINVAQSVTSIELDKKEISLVIGEEATLSASVLPNNAKDKSYTWSSSDSAIASVDNSGKVTAKARGKATIIATANDGSGVFDSCSVSVYNISEPIAVDMGIVVNGKNIKWATFNIGASVPEEYGLLYAWGETKHKDNYSWSNYKWGESPTTLTKYTSSSSSVVLSLDDDVAHVKFGGNWRLPTDKEWTELRTKCTWTWTANYKGTGACGRIVTSTNGNSIFLPAAGFCDTDKVAAGAMGYYWSSSLYTGYPRYARCVYFNSNDGGGVYRGYDFRFEGFSVRPVTE